MPAYVNSPFGTTQLLQKGVPTYLIGSKNLLADNTRLSMVTDSIASNVATIVTSYLTGPLPPAGSLISITGSANSSSAFNVNRVAITSATMNATNNQVTIVFPLTAANQAATADNGTIVVEPAEIPETIAASYTSEAVVVQAPGGDSQFTLPIALTGAAGITAMTATLQCAINNVDSEFTAVNPAVTIVKTGASTYSSGPVVQATLQRGYVYRLAVTGVTGSGAVVAKIG